MFLHPVGVSLAESFNLVSTARRESLVTYQGAMTMIPNDLFVVFLCLNWISPLLLAYATLDGDFVETIHFDSVAIAIIATTTRKVGSRSKVLHPPTSSFDRVSSIVYRAILVSMMSQA